MLGIRTRSQCEIFICDIYYKIFDKLKPHGAIVV